MTTTSHHYTTSGGIEVAVEVAPLPYEGACDGLIAALDTRRGVLFSSGMEAPGRYTRWDMGFVDPPLALTSVERRFELAALNARGQVLLPGLLARLERCNHLCELRRVEAPHAPHAEVLGEAEPRSTRDGAIWSPPSRPASRAPQDEVGGVILGSIRPATGSFPEEERSRQPSIFSLLRHLRDLFGSPEDRHLGLYGAFAYDLAYQFEPIRRHIPRAEDQRDLVLYLADELVVVDHAARVAERRRYEFALDGVSTAGLARDDMAPDPSPPGEGGSERSSGTGGVTHASGEVTAPGPPRSGASRLPPPPAGGGSIRRDAAAGSDHGPGDYAATVAFAKEHFARGDLFEVVPGQTFRAPCPDAPSAVFRRLVAANPAPYGGLLNLGEGEFLVAASPEMFVRVRGARVETCPISGTIARGRDAFEDADQIRALLASAKDEAELTMCTDVDRNDKARICEPGSVRVIARRQIETYSRLFHTVDHVEGRLRPERDALDAFLSHAWAVTVTGAPKRRAMEFIERHERSARRWYGGAIGRLTFDGNMDTGITIRTVRLKDGMAEVRAGATLLHDSDPEAEDAECALKASAMLASIAGTAAMRPGPGAATRSAEGRRVLLVDFEDSFVHTLGDYVRQTGAAVSTFRHDSAVAAIGRERPDLVVLSPGPGRPAEFGMDAIVAAALERAIPIFGVCLGLQGLAEHFGGALGQLDEPVHGKASDIAFSESRLFGPAERLTVGRYHSLYADADSLPACLKVAALSDDGIVMALEHATLPVAAVQFHPESILSARGARGLQLVASVLGRLLAESDAALNTPAGTRDTGSGAGPATGGHSRSAAAAAG